MGKSSDNYLPQPAEDPDKPGVDLLERYLRPLTQETMDKDRLAFLNAVRDRHLGKTLICLGTGPSVKTVSRTLIQRFTTLGCNGIGRVIQPDYYLIADPFVYALHKDVFDASQGTRILSSFTEGNCDLRLYYRREDLIGLSREAIYSADSAGYLLISVAAVMGAKRIVLAGYDGYPPGRRIHHCYKEAPVETERVKWEWERPTSEKQRLTRRGFRHAAEVAPSLGLEIRLLTPSPFLGDLFASIKPWDLVST